ncbi:MAG: site-2 protease family protein [Sulfolobales archaeon]
MPEALGAQDSIDNILSITSKYFLIKEVYSLSQDYMRLSVIPRELGRSIDHVKKLYKELMSRNYQIILRENEKEFILEIHRLRNIGKVSRRVFTLFLLLTITTVSITAYTWILSWVSLQRDLGIAYTNLSISLRAIILVCGILFVLAFHEFGHFIVSRILGIASTIPLFIPGVPGITLGTFGAVIFMRALPSTLEDLAILAIAGPSAGFLASLVLSLYGLSLSIVIPPTTSLPSETVPINVVPMIFLILENIFFGKAEGYVLLSPEALAAYLLILIHFMNLLPVGQLDGGQIMRSIVSPRVHISTSFLLVTILLLFSLITRDTFLTSMGIFLLIIFLITGLSTPNPVASYEKFSSVSKKVVILIIWITLLFLTMPVPIT